MSYSFQVITDSRFDGNDEQCLELIKNRVFKITNILELIKIKGVSFSSEQIRKLEFNSKTENNIQYRCDFIINKKGRSITWNEVFKKINEIKPVCYVKTK